MKYVGKFKGKEYMIFTNNATDKERIDVSIINLSKKCVQFGVEKNKILDPSPASKTIYKAWDLRPRSKEKELGELVRFTAKNQIERIVDGLSSRVLTSFDNTQLMGI